MCQQLGVKRSAYYSHLQREKIKPDDPTHGELIDWVQDIAEASDNTYGYRRMKTALNVLGYPWVKAKPGH